MIDMTMHCFWVIKELLPVFSPQYIHNTGSSSTSWKIISDRKIVFWSDLDPFSGSFGCVIWYFNGHHHGGPGATPTFPQKVEFLQEVGVASPR